MSKVHGGKRPGAGRPKGSKSKESAIVKAERKKIEAVVEARRREIEASVEIARSRSARRQGARSSLMARPSRCTATEVMP